CAEHIIGRVGAVALLDEVGLAADPRNGSPGLFGPRVGYVEDFVLIIAWPHLDHRRHRLLRVGRPEAGPTGRSIPPAGAMLHRAPVKPAIRPVEGRACVPHAHRAAVANEGESAQIAVVRARVAMHRLSLAWQECETIRDDASLRRGSEERDETVEDEIEADVQ